MKLLLILAPLFSFLVSADGCKKKPANAFKGRLEVKALCMNYTISVIEGDIDTSLVVPSWTDESTNKTYKNAFALGSRCTFPAEIKEGEEFYFVIDSSASQQCAVCMAYYPTPEKKLPIKVVTQ